MLIHFDLTDCTQGGEAAGQWLSFVPNAALASAAMDRIFGLRQSRMCDQGGGEQSLGPNSGGVRIAMENVHFQYPTRDTAVFKGLSLTVFDLTIYVA